MNGFLNRCHIRHVIFGTFPTINDQRWADKAHQRFVVLTIGMDGIQQVRVVLPESAIDDAEYLLWRLHIAYTDYMPKEGILVSKEMVCKVY